MQLLRPYQFVPSDKGGVELMGSEIQRLMELNPGLEEVISDFQRVRFTDSFGLYLNHQNEWFAFLRNNETDIVELTDSSIIESAPVNWDPIQHAHRKEWIFISNEFQYCHSTTYLQGHPIQTLTEILGRFIDQTHVFEELISKLRDLGIGETNGEKAFSYKGMLINYAYEIIEVREEGCQGLLIVLEMAHISRPFEKFSADFYKVVLNSAAVDIAVFDTDHRYMLINEFAVKNREIRNWLIGRTDFDYCTFRNTDDTMAKFRETAFKQSRDEKKMVEIEETITDKDGNKHYTVKRFKPIIIDNEVRYMMGFGMDVTALKRAQDQLVESEERYRELFESSMDIIQSIDKNGKFIFVNRAWYKLFGYSQEELVTLNLFDIIAPSSITHCLDMFSAVLQGKSMTDIHAVFLSKDGREITLEGNVSPRMVGDEVVSTHAFFRDVTDRELKDEQLRASLVEKEALLGEIHHRVKNNLAVVYSLLELQAMQEKNSEIAFAYRESQSRIKAMALVHEMLYQDHSFGSVDLFAYLKGLSEHLRSLLAVDKKVELCFKGNETRIMMTQAVSCGLFANEVLTNAYKYAVPVTSEPIIRISVHSDEEEVNIAISDNGPGLPTSFESVKSNSLGFKLMKTFTAQLKGELSVQSEEGLSYSLKFRR